jgi:hypothetical protein
MIRLFGVAEQVFVRNVMRHFPPDAIWREGDSDRGRLWFHGRRCIEAWARAQFAPKAVAVDVPADPFAKAGGGSGEPGSGGENWEARLVEEKARLANLERLAREQSLLSRDRVHLVMERVGGILRRSVEGVQREYGAEAAALIDEALDDAEREVRSLGGAEAGDAGSIEAGSMGKGVPEAPPEAGPEPGPTGPDRQGGAAGTGQDSPPTQAGAPLTETLPVVPRGADAGGDVRCSD